VRGVGAHGVLDVDGRLAVDGLGVLLEHLALALDGRLVRLERVAEDAWAGKGCEIPNFGGS
jgi:hypothetical protein